MRIRNRSSIVVCVGGKYFFVVFKGEEGNKVCHNCFAYGVKSDILKEFK